MQNINNTKTHKKTYCIGWFLWSLAALFYGYEFFHRVLPSVITTSLRSSLDINDKQLGLVGAMYLYAYAACQLPAGMLIDKFGPKRLLVLASLIVTIGSFLFALSTSYPVTCFSRLLIGAGSAFAFVGCLKIGSVWLSMSTFPLIVGLTNFCGTLGALLGGAPLSILIDSYNSKFALVQISFIGLVITLLLTIFLKDNPDITSKYDSETHMQKSPPLLKGLEYVFFKKQSWYIGLFGALLVLPIAALPEMWGPEYVAINFMLPKTQAAGLTHTIFIGTAIGGPLIGLVAMRIQNLNKIIYPATLGAFLLLSIFLYSTFITPKLLYPLLFMYGALTANMLLIFTLIKQQYPEWVQGAAIGFINMIIMLCGGLSQYGIGWFLDYFRSQHNGTYLLIDYQKALSILPLSLFCAIFLIRLMIPKSKNAD